MSEDDTPQENTASYENRTHEIDGIGGVRARVGTSTEELAGAASYWNKEAKALQARLDHFTAVESRKWRDGFLTGVVSFAVVVGLIAGYATLLH